MLVRTGTANAKKKSGGTSRGVRASENDGSRQRRDGSNVVASLVIAIYRRLEFLYTRAVASLQL